MGHPLNNDLFTETALENPSTFPCIERHAFISRREAVQRYVNQHLHIIIHPGIEIDRAAEREVYVQAQRAYSASVDASVLSPIAILALVALGVYEKSFGY